MIKIYSKTEMTLLIPDRMEGLLPDGGGLSLGGWRHWAGAVQEAVEVEGCFSEGLWCWALPVGMVG